MDYDHPLRRVLVTGISGSGKTGLAIHLLRNWPKAQWVFCYDQHREFARKTGWGVAINKEEIIRLASQCRPVCFDPVPMFNGDNVAGLEWYSGIVLSISKTVNGVKVLGVDEAWECTERTLGPNLRAIYHRGRREEIDSLATTQALNETHPVMRAQLSQLWTFAQDDVLPLDWLSKRGFDREEIQNLKSPGGFIVKENRKFRRGTTSKRGEPFYDSGTA